MTFYGQKIHSGLQVGGETLYMPHWIYHSVYNVANTMAVGDNFLLASSFEEMAVSIDEHRMNKVLRRLNDRDQERVKAVTEQVKKANKQTRKKAKT
jgi:hypothetical protein